MPALGVLRTDPHGVVQAEAGVAPAAERANRSLINAPFPEEHLEHPVTEEVLQGIQTDLGKRHEPAGRRKEAVGYQGMEVGVEVDQVAIGLDGDDDPGDRLRLP